MTWTGSTGRCRKLLVRVSEGVDRGVRQALYRNWNGRVWAGVMSGRCAVRTLFHARQFLHISVPKG